MRHVDRAGFRSAASPHRSWTRTEVADNLQKPLVMGSICDQAQYPRVSTIGSGEII